MAEDEENCKILQLFVEAYTSARFLPPALFPLSLCIRFFFTKPSKAEGLYVCRRQHGIGSAGNSRPLLRPPAYLGPSLFRLDPPAVPPLATHSPQSSNTGLGGRYPRPVTLAQLSRQKLRLPVEFSFRHARDRRVLRGIPPGVGDALRSAGIEPRKIGFAQTVWYFSVTRTLQQRTGQPTYSLQDRSVVTVPSRRDVILCLVCSFQFSIRL